MSCEFGATLDEALRDRFVSGIRNEACQRRLLSESNLTFARAFEIALSMETAEKDTQQLRGYDSRPGEVHKVDARAARNSDQRGKTCYRCHGKDHSPQVCHFKEAKCHNCGKIGHIKRACRGKTGKSKHFTVKNTKYVEAEEAELPMFSLLSDEKDKKSFTETFKVNGKEIMMEIDTGAAMSIISEKLFQAAFPTEPLEVAGVKLKTYTGEIMPVLGQFKAKVSYEGQSVLLPLIVVKGEGPALCGRNWLQKLTLNWKKIKHVSQVHQPKTLQEVLDSCPEVFKEELGTLIGIKAKILVNSEISPRFCIKQLLQKRTHYPGLRS